MADLKISELGALAGGDLVAADELAIVDDSASETKKITVSNLIANGVTLISDDAIPGAKILFGAGDIATAALADSAVTAAKIGLDAVTGPKIADNVIVNLVSTLPASGAYTGQLALDTDDNNVYVWNGSAWLSIKAPGSVNAFTNTTAGIINISTAVSGGTATITASIDDTTSAGQFLAGPVGSAGTVSYRTINGGDLPTATTTSKGGVIVNGGGLTLSGSTVQISNSVSASSVNHLVQYDANGLITAGSTIGSSDLPAATSSAKGAVFIGSGGGLTVNASGNLSVDNTVTSGTYTKVTVTAKGLVSAGATLTDADIPNHSAAKLTSGTIGTSRIASDAITAAKLADQSTTKFGGAASSDNVTIFPDGDFQGQFFYDETTQDLYIYTGSAFVPITVLSGNLVNAGAYNANTNQMSSVTSAGSSAGFTTGNALPAPAVTNLNHYVVVDTSGTGSGAAPAVALAPPDMLLSQGVGTEYSLIDVSNAIAGQTASNISLIATGDIVATNVQAGITELDQEKLPKAGGTMTGDLNLGTSRNLVFEGSTANDFETTLTVTDPTADRTITLPNVTGTVVTTGDTGSVTSTMITDGTIINADISASAEIAVSKLANGTARQLLQTDSGGSGVEFTSNVDVPGTLDVTNAATFDSTVAVTGVLSANGKLAYPAGSAAAVGLYAGSDTDTGIYSPGSNQFGIATAGTSRVVIDASGNVGIGTASAGSRFNVTDTDSSSTYTTGASLAGQTSIYKQIIHTNQSSGTNEAGILLRAGVDASATEWGISAVRTGTTVGDLVLRTRTAASTSSEQIRVDSNGKLIIGASSFISGANSFTQAMVSGGDGGLIINSTNTSANSYSRLMFTPNGHITGNEGMIRYNTNDYHMAFWTKGNERMSIDSSGKVFCKGNYIYVQDSNTGFGVSDGLALITDGNSDKYIWNHENTSLRFGNNNTEKMRIDNNGNVGIGLSASLSGLCVNNTIRSQNSSSNISYIGFTTYQSSATVGTMFSYIGGDARSTGFLNFNTNDTERMRIQSDGNILMGRTNSLSITHTLSLNKDDSVLGINTNNATATSVTLYSQGTPVGSISVTASATSYNTSSDYRLKQNVVDIADGITRVKQLQPKRFNFIADAGTTVDGFVAHEAQTIVPEAVTGEKDGEEMQGIDQSKLVPLLTAALKEAIAKIETLEAKVAALEAG
jgi:hypothetical protein